MNNILVQSSKFKFLENTTHTVISNWSVITSVFHNNIYKLFYSINPRYILFDVTQIDNEIIAFLEDKCNSVNCYIYHDLFDQSVVDILPKNIKHIYRIGTTNNHMKLPDNLINAQIYSAFDQIESKKSSDIICFLDYVSALPDALIPYLLPNNAKLKIKLFHNASIIHDQNLGLLTIHKKAELLFNAKYYLSLDSNDPYIPEAIYSGCHILDINMLSNIEQSHSSKFKNEHIQQDTFLLENLLV